MALPPALASGHWYTSAGDGRIPHIARDDIAAAIAAGLTKPAANKIYTLTGATALTTQEVAERVAKETGKPLAVVQVTDEQLAGGMKAAGVPEGFIPTLVSFDTTTRNGGLATVTSDAATLSGRTLVTLDEFLAKNAVALGG